MSILIKDMDIPKKDSVMLWVLPNGVACVMDDSGQQYKIIEIPPHGRLIDADALKQKVFAMDWGAKHYPDKFMDEIVHAPTIIEAEQ